MPDFFMQFLSPALTQALAEFHFLRPWTLFSLVPGTILAILLSNRHKQSGSWKGVFAPELLPYLIEQDKAKKQYHRWLLLPWVCASLALAGPTWQKTPLPINKQQTPLVILFDLSP